MHILRKMKRNIKMIVFKILSPEKISKIHFNRQLGYPLNLQKPKSFNEKLQWLKLHFYPQTPLATQCTDKYEVRQYINKIGLGQYLNDLIQVWDRAEDIVWRDLPQQFAIKCTHGCGYNILCKSKAELDFAKASKQLNGWLKEKYGKRFAEAHYNKIKPRIICERYLGEDLVNYKFFCFYGEPRFMYIVQGSGAEKRLTSYDMDMNIAPYKQNFLPVIDTETTLEGFHKMAEICRTLSRGFPFVRVDLYKIDGQICFGELTFTPSAGMERFEPKEYDQKLGDLLPLEELMRSMQ